MLKNLLSFGKKKARNWHVLDFRSGSLDTIPLTPETPPQQLTDISPWHISTGQNGMHLSCDDPKWASIVINDHRYDAQRLGAFDEAKEYFAIVPTYQGDPIPMLIVGGDEPAWVNQGGQKFSIWHDITGDPKGPLAFAQLEEHVQAHFGRLPFGSFARASNGSEACFYVRDLWPDGVTAEQTAAPVKAEDSTIVQPKTGGNATPASSPPLQAELSAVSKSSRHEKSQGSTLPKGYTPPKNEGEFVCLHCDHRFNRGSFLYFPKHPLLLGNPPFLPSYDDFDADGIVRDSRGSACTRRACPHCLKELPQSFGRHPYEIFSLLGRASSGKSYFLATMLKVVTTRLEGWGFGVADDDARLNSTLRSLSGVPFNHGDPVSRYIDKTSEGQATQEEITVDEVAVSVPKPFILRVRKKEPEVEKRLVFYDNPGEHFTDVWDEGPRAIEAGIATGHVAHASAIFVLYDPLRTARFVAALPEENRPRQMPDSDLQVGMLAKAGERLFDQLGGYEAIEARSRPLALMVGKWDSWTSLAPDLEMNYFDTAGRLNLSVVRRNSEIIKNMLNRFDTGIVGAATDISDEVVYFPVSSLGHGPVATELPKTRGGIEVFAPSQPAEPRCVEVPIVWALWRSSPHLIPTTDV